MPDLAVNNEMYHYISNTSLHFLWNINVRKTAKHLKHAKWKIGSVASCLRC